MRPSILTDWTAAKAAAFTRETVRFRHQLQQRLTFSDAVLVDLLSRYPRERVAVFTMGADRTSWRRGVADDLSGAELFRAAQTGRIWLSLPAIHEHHPDYARFAPQVRTFRRGLTLSLSSPGAVDFYQAGLAATATYQIRGERELWVYPSGEPHVRDEALERRVLGEGPRHLDYDPAWDAAASRLELAAGTMACWAPGAPYRSVNRGFNVTLTAEFMTPAAQQRVDVLYANARLRRSLGVRPAIQQGLHPAALGKAALAQVLQGLGGKRRFKPSRPEFKLARSHAA